MTTLPTLDELRAQHERFRALGLALSMERGQPSDEDLDLSNPMLSIVGPGDTTTPSGLDIRNYPGGPAGLPEARALFARALGVAPGEVMVGNNASLKLMAEVLMWALLRGLETSPAPWVQGRPRMIVTVPGYDRHFLLLERLGFELTEVAITPDGPDIDAVEAAARDPEVKGILFVPTYSNPTGDTLSAAAAERLARLGAAAPDFTVFADDAYRFHHLAEPTEPLDLLAIFREAGRPDGVIQFASTSKITFGGGGLGFLATSETNVAYLSRLFGTSSIGPNKVEQYRHVRFLEGFPGGLEGLMRRHAELIAPKFAAVREVLERELAGAGLARWSDPAGGYFITLTTERPVATRVVELAGEVGVALTPAGATHPGGVDPSDRTLRLAPTRPPLGEVRRAMEVVAHCVRLASAEHDTGAP